MQEALGIIGGSGLTRLNAMTIERREVVPTPYGEPSAPLAFGRLDDIPVVFVPRHGSQHSIPPHRVNYRANIWALHQAGVKSVIGIAAVGGITAPPGSLCIPDQLIDYTWGRAHTFFDGPPERVVHVDFTEPYCAALREQLIATAGRLDISIRPTGVYGATQGPRLETAQEIARMAGDGCDLVGMTGMPEAALAKEMELCYACCAAVVNWAAGKGDGPITMKEIETNLGTVMTQVRTLLAGLQG